MTGPLAVDLDGTLVDCRARQVALAAALAGPGFDGDAFWEAKRAGATTRAALVALGHPDAAARALADAWAEAIEDDAWLAHDRLLPGARAALEAAGDAGLEPFVLTARRRADAVRAQVDRLGLAALVAGVEVVDPGDAAAAKGALLAARGAVALIGDTESDAAGAAAAGVPFVAVGGGQRAPGFLRARGVAVVHPDVGAAVAALLAAR